MNRKTMTDARALFATALASAALLTVTAGCQQNKKPADDDAAMQPMATPDTNLRSGIPQEAVEVGQQSESPSYTADRDGRLFIYNRSENKLVNAFQMRKGQNMIIAGQEGRATLDGNEVAVNQIMPGRTYTLYFLPSPDSSSSSGNGSASGDTFRITPAGSQ